MEPNFCGKDDRTPYQSKGKPNFYAQKTNIESPFELS